MARPKNPNSFPTTPGVYSIWEVHAGVEEGKWDECLYVGMASNLRNRLNQHNLLIRYLKHRCQVMIKYKEVPYDKLRAAESFLIAEFKPTLNQIFPASVQVEDLDIP